MQRYRIYSNYPNKNIYFFTFSPRKRLLYTDYTGLLFKINDFTHYNLAGVKYFTTFAQQSLVKIRTNYIIILNT